MATLAIGRHVVPLAVDRCRLSVLTSPPQGFDRTTRLRSENKTNLSSPLRPARSMFDIDLNGPAITQIAETLKGTQPGRSFEICGPEQQEEIVGSPISSDDLSKRSAHAGSLCGL